MVINVSLLQCVVCFYSGHQTCGRTSRGHTDRRKVTQDSSTFLLRCLPSFFSREGFSRPFLSSTVKPNFVYPRINRSPYNGGFLPGIILLLTLCHYLLHWGNHYLTPCRALSLQPMFPPKYFDNFPPEGGCSEG